MNHHSDRGSTPLISTTLLLGGVSVPRGILEFDLPEEEPEFVTAQEAGRWKSAIEEYDNWLRNIVKHGDLPELEYSAYKACRDKLHEVLNEDSLHFD